MRAIIVIIVIIVHVFTTRARVAASGSSLGCIDPEGPVLAEMTKLDNFSAVMCGIPATDTRIALVT